MNTKDLFVIFGQKSKDITDQMMERVIKQTKELHSEDPRVDKVCELIRQMAPIVLYAYKQGGYDFARLVMEKGGKTNKSNKTAN